MFGLKNILKKASSPSVKMVASNNFLDTLNNLKETTVKERDNKRNDNSIELLEQAKEIIEQCVVSGNFNLDSLKDAAEKLINSIEYNRQNGDAYISLANIFYVLGNNQASLKYLRIAKSLNTNIEEVDNLIEIISSESINKVKSVSVEEQKNDKNNLHKELPKVKLSTIRRI